jgi:RHH-type transcriptional regulator, proline utilization regulon repressor / proline dehydrogenase / delta 1-pyrroline-5-carboxylate dehydrogenase
VDINSKLNGLRAAISAMYLADETQAVADLLPLARSSTDAQSHIDATARRLAEAVRAHKEGALSVESFLRQFSLSSREGVLLMCVAEALLRIPDHATALKLIRDKISQGDWEQYVGCSDSLLINASTWGLLLTGRLIAVDEQATDALGGLKRLIARSGAPVVRLALTQAMRILAEQFVMGRSIEEALARSAEAQFADYRMSFDMLGEAALTQLGAQRYQQSYAAAIGAIGAAVRPGADSAAAPSISVKLSALHPRYEYVQRERAVPELSAALLELVQAAKTAGIGLTVDAEESERLEASLDIFERVFADPSLAGYDGLGLAVQAYQKRSLAVIDWLAALAHTRKKRIPLRLVKGAYWDSEIKRAQSQGLAGYPVYTRKAATDVSYLACAERIISLRDRFYPQFATHNAYTVAFILARLRQSGDFEFQRLHGMGVDLYHAVAQQYEIKCRVYAPVGSHEHLLPYLVRRLLENGANTSFVNRLADYAQSIEDLIADPVRTLNRLWSKPNPHIPLPSRVFAPHRANSSGISFADPVALAQLHAQLQAPLQRSFEARPLVGGVSTSGETRAIHAPADQRQIVGVVQEANTSMLDQASAAAAHAAFDWNATAADQRAEVLERAADLIEGARHELLALLAREAGKTLPDGLAEIREAADYCRYYGQLARQQFAAPLSLPGTTGEANELRLTGRGVYAAISPWNFPLAIFVGQISAALAAGNAVIAKPARQTPLIGYQAVQLLHQAGVPAQVLHYVPGPGAALGARLAGDERIAGVVFTGSTDTGQTINRTLAARRGPIIPLIAETGGQNAMIVDSSALPEQVVADVLQSAFNSAGQRCSALRVLFLQNEIVDRVLELLTGAMQELVIGDPTRLTTDVGPVIDAAAQAQLRGHIIALRSLGKPVCELTLSPETEQGCFVAPCVFEIPSLQPLEREVFGPILHVIRYGETLLDNVVEAINATGYGLTLGIQSRIDTTVRRIQARARVGNIYVNRNMIGAVVGAQPFGGEGLSGSGPKAGGPHYLLRFATERVTSTNTAAAGGNAALLSLDE